MNGNEQQLREMLAKKRENEDIYARSIAFHFIEFFSQPSATFWKHKNVSSRRLTYGNYIRKNL